MKSETSVFISVCVIGLTIGNRSLAQDHPSWILFSGTLPANAVAGGREANGQTLYISRAAFESGIHPGKTRADWNYTNIEYGGKEVRVKPFDLLVSDGFVLWQPPGQQGMPMHALSGGSENNHEMFVCRCTFAGGVHIGKTWEGLNACNIGYAGQGLSHPDYEVLVDPWYPVSALGKFPVNAFAGGVDTDGVTLYVARVRHNNTWQPGKARRDWATANIGYASEELALETFEVLLDDSQFVWQRPGKGMPPNAVSTGTENGTKLVICRCNHGDGSKQIGRVDRSGKCNYGYGSVGRTTADFEVLTYTGK